MEQGENAGEGGRVAGGGHSFTYSFSGGSSHLDTCLRLEAQIIVLSMVP